MANELGDEKNSPAHDSLLGNLATRKGVMSALPGGLFLWRATCAEAPVLLYPTAVVNAISEEAARMQWAERKASMEAADEAVNLRELLQRSEERRSELVARAIKDQTEIGNLKVQLHALKLAYVRSQRQCRSRKKRPRARA